MFRKVVVSHIGELTEDTRTVGDTVRYRIYYTNAEGILTEPQIPNALPEPIRPVPVIPDPADLIIIDPLDHSLSNITVFNGGRYNPTTHSITWVLKSRLPRRFAFVEFEAVIGSTNLIRNQAFLKRIGPRLGGIKDIGKTNIVETTVGNPPQLGWIPFVQGAKPEDPIRVYMKDETTMGTTVRFDVPGVFVYEEKVRGVTYQHLSIAGWTTLTDVGKPELPILGEIVEVPFDVHLTPEIVEAKTTELDGYNIYPAQPSQIDAPRPVQPFVVDKTTYLADRNYPSALAVAEGDDIAVIRGHRVAILKINPLQYNPITRKVTAYSTIEVRLNYDHPAQLKGVDRRIESPAFEELLQASVLNYKDPQRFDRPQSEGNEELTGCDYLIITHDDFYDERDPSNPIVRLADWKQRKGYTTKVVKVNSIPGGGNTADAIRNYIQDAYDHWNSVPSYILLVGDSDHVVACSGSADTPPIQTDLDYVTVDGADYFPDIYLGRLSVDSLQQTTDVVNKILRYEQNPPAVPANADFYSNVTLVGEFTDSDKGNSTIDGRERRPWIANLESIRQFLRTEGYTAERVYATDSGFPAIPNTQVPLQYEDGTNLPNDLLFPNYGWDGGSQDIRDAINHGCFLVTYRGHGAWDGWEGPSFNNSDIGGLNQNNLTPVIFSITCQTGWFDNETDDDAHGGRPANDDSFTEVMLRQPRAGAVALLGMTRNSYTGWNDFLIFGAHRAIWPTFAPNPPWNNHPTIPAFATVRLLRMGQILNFAKMYMATVYAPSSKRRVEFEMGHLFGDPEMPIWTEAPDDLAVVHPAGIGAIGTQEFLVQVMDKANGQSIRNATVVLTRNKAIIQWQQTNSGGVARFNLTSTGGGDLDITVTALNFRPYMGKITVKSTGAVINRLDPPDGPEGQTIHVGGQSFQSGERIDLYFGDLPPTTVLANGSGAFGHGTPTVDISVPVGYAHGLVNVLAYGRTSGRYAVRIFQVRDENPLDLWTYDQWDSSTWFLHPGDNPTWDSPDIQIYDQSGSPVASNNLTLGETYIVKVNVRNKTAFDAKEAKVVFKWRNYGAGGPWEEFPAGGMVTLDVPKDPPSVAIAETDFSPHVTGHICIRAAIEHLEDTSPGNNEGQENLHVGYSNSPTEICFFVWNLTEEAAPVHLEVRQLMRPSGEQKERLWGTWVKHPEPQILKPGERGEACIIVDPDVADVRPGTLAEFAVTAFIGSRMIGGVNVIMVKQ